MEQVRDRNLNILVIDDLRSARKVLLKHLATIGNINGAEATDGKEALSLIEQTPFDLILSDCHMPNMDGLQLLAELRSAEPTKSLPFILITGSAHKETIEKALSLGVSDIMIKPFSADTLKEKINGAIDKLAATLSGTAVE